MHVRGCIYIYIESEHSWSLLFTYKQLSVDSTRAARVSYRRTKFTLVLVNVNIASKHQASITLGLLPCFVCLPR